MNKKFITTLISLFLFQTAFAVDCKCKPEDLQAVTKDYKAAKLVFIGHLLNSTVLVDRAWTTGPNNYNISDPSKKNCSVKMEPKKRYLVFGATPDNVSVCNTVAFDLSTSPKELKIALGLKPEPGRGFNPAWFTCLKDSDCVLKSNACEQNIGINGTFAELFGKFAKPGTGGFKCPPPKKVSKATCDMNLCSAI